MSDQTLTVIRLPDEVFAQGETRQISDGRWYLIKEIVDDITMLVIPAPWYRVLWATTRNWIINKWRLLWEI